MAGGSFTMQQQTGPSPSSDFWSQFPTSGPGAPKYAPANAPPAAQMVNGQPVFTNAQGQQTDQQGNPLPSGGNAPDPQSAFMEAVQALGIAPQQFRANPAVMNQVTDYLNKKYPGMNWSNGGARAGDWVSVNGQGFDVLPSGDRNWQWLSDPASSTAGSGGGGFNPMMTGGLGMSAIPGDIVESLPGYNFAVNQAQKAIERGAAAKGTLLTGGLQEQLGLDIGQGLALPAYQSEVSNLYNLAGLGENAAAGYGNALGAFGNQSGNLLTGIGNAQAAGSIGSGNAWAGALGGIGNDAMLAYLLHQQQQKQGSSYPGVGVGP